MDKVIENMVKAIDLKNEKGVTGYQLPLTKTGICIQG